MDVSYEGRVHCAIVPSRVLPIQRHLTPVINVKLAMYLPRELPDFTCTCTTLLASISLRFIQNSDPNSGS